MSHWIPQDFLPSRNEQDCIVSLGIRNNSYLWELSNEIKLSREIVFQKDGKRPCRFRYFSTVGGWDYIYQLKQNCSNQGDVMIPFCVKVLWPFKGQRKEEKQKRCCQDCSAARVCGGTFLPPCRPPPAPWLENVTSFKCDSSIGLDHA